MTIIDEKKKSEIKAAQAFIDAIDNDKSKYVAHKAGRPVADLRHMIETSAELYADNVAFKQRFEKNMPYADISYRRMFDEVCALGTALISRGLKGKHIAIIGDNCYQWAVTYLAATCGVGVAVPMDKELSEEELSYIVKDADVSAVVFTRKHHTTMTRIAKMSDTSIELLVNINLEEDEEMENVSSWSKLVKDGKLLMADGDESFLKAQVSGDDMAAVLYTSGTTGLSKGVMLSHKNLCTELMSAPTVLCVNSWDVFFSVLPIHHTYECTCGFLIPLYKGATVAYCEGLKYIARNLEEVRPTMLLGVPLIFESIYKKIWKGIEKKGREGLVKDILKVNRRTNKIGLNLCKIFMKDIFRILGGEMRVLISGGAAIDQEILDFFNALGLIAVQGYGLTECAPMAALNPDRQMYMKSKSVGRVLPGMEVKIDAPSDNGIGEICVKGDNVMMGYYKNQEATDKVIEDGWLRTGDMGYIDEDDYVYITGRVKNVIIAKNGKNVFPEEIEYLIKKISFVEDVMVWAEYDGQADDNLIVATVKPDIEEVISIIGEEDARYDPEITHLIWQEVDKINESLPIYKKVRRVYLHKDDFEKTTAKKIKRFVDGNKR